MTDYNLEAFGLHWRVGRNWGVAHPKHKCYADAGEVDITDDTVRLGVGLKPRTFFNKTYPWAVGYLSSLETFKYGVFEFTYSLPLGLHLWPAIWLCDGQTWPPEIDIIEAWSGRSWLSRHGRRCYAGLPFMTRMVPGVHNGPLDLQRGKSGGWFNGRYTPSWLTDERGLNRCKLVWTPDYVEVYYNGCRVWHHDEAKAIADLNASEGMEIHLNNYVSDDFSYDDYVSLRRRDLTVLSFTHKPLAK